MNETIAATADNGTMKTASDAGKSGDARTAFGRDAIGSVLDRISTGAGAICGISILIMMLIISYEVVARYLFNSPTSWVTEYSLYIFIGASFLAAGYAHVQDAHIRVEILLNKMSDAKNLRLRVIGAWIGLIYLTVSTWQMTLFVVSEYRAGARAWGLLVTPLWIPESAVALGLGVFALAVFNEIRRFSMPLSRNKDVFGILILMATGAALLGFGFHPPKLGGFAMDLGTAVIVLALCLLSWVFNGRDVGIGTALLSVGGGLIFSLAGDFNTLQQGMVIAAYLLILLALGVRIVFSLGMVGALGVLFLLPTPQLQAMAEQAWTGVNSFTYTAVPMFILMGAFLLRSGVTSDLFAVMLKWMGRFPGGIAHATVAACGIFAAVSGSSLATAATMGMTAGPEMTKNGYSPRLTYGVISAGGTLGILIPPSIAMIIYGSLVGEPISVMFIAGITPGILLMISFMTVVLVWSFVRPEAAPRGEYYSWKEKFAALGGVLPFLILIFGVLGSLYMGIATPTEAGAIGALLATVLCFAKGKMSWRTLMDSLLETAKVTSFLILIVTAASIMSYTFAYTRLPKTLVELVQNANLGPALVMTILVGIYIVLGMFIDPISMMLMTWSVSVPVVTALGMDPVWFGVVLVMMIEIGLITPPVGVILFILRGMSGEVELKEIIMGALPFVGIFLLNIALFYLFPGLIMWLPNQMGNMN